MTYGNLNYLKMNNLCRVLTQKTPVSQCIF